MCVGMPLSKVIFNPKTITPRWCTVNYYLSLIPCKHVYTSIAYTILIFFFLFLLWMYCTRKRLLETKNTDKIKQAEEAEKNARLTCTHMFIGATFDRCHFRSQWNLIYRPSIEKDKSPISWLHQILLSLSLPIFLNFKFVLFYYYYYF